MSSICKTWAVEFENDLKIVAKQERTLLLSALRLCTRSIHFKLIWVFKWLTTSCKVSWDKTNGSVDKLLQ